MLTVDEVRANVERIEAMAGDGEAAHSAEDDLRQLVLEAIAKGHPEAAELAAAALETGSITFERWCA